MIGYTSRTLLAAALAGVAAAPVAAKVRMDDPASISGAIYIPYGAYNAPQMWKNFDPAETERDLGYARRIHLNGLRVWASYEYWQMEPAKFKANFDRFLAIARKHDIRILISLFEQDGEAPTPENMWATDPVHGLDVQSPGNAITRGAEAGWEAPRGFIRWFMQHYASDDRLLAIEVMNEPAVGGNKGGSSVPFAKSMLQTAKSMQGSVPLTIGCAGLDECRQYLPLGIDLMEYHNNFPRSADGMKRSLDNAVATSKETGKPVWLTEWQWVRPTASGFGRQPIPEAERGPNYASLAPTVNAYPVATFFWSLMVKRAYLKPQRNKGTVNGLFWPDGSVVSLADARAIAQDSSLQLKEKPLPAAFGMEAAQSRAAQE